MTYAGGQAGTWGHRSESLARLRDGAWEPVRDLALRGCIDCAPAIYTLHTRQEQGAAVLYAAGTFDTVSGAVGGGIARWDGQRWDALGGGTWFGPPFPRIAGVVNAVVEHDDGRGSALFVGGNFDRAGQGAEATPNVARWSPEAREWAPVGVQTGFPNGSVMSLVSWEDGGRPCLVAGGQFNAIGGVTAKNVARWDGSEWSAMGEGLTDRVTALAVFDDGSGPALYAAGHFALPGGRGLARWDGTAWRLVGGGVEGKDQPVANALAVGEDEGRPALFVGGSFIAAGGMPSVNVAVWKGCVACYPDCDTTTGPGVLDIFDFLCFQSRFDVAAPYACDCDTSTGRGVCDIFDFLCFQNAFDAGCP